MKNNKVVIALTCVISVAVVGILGYAYFKESNRDSAAEIDKVFGKTGTKQGTFVPPVVTPNEGVARQDQNKPLSAEVKPNTDKQVGIGDVASKPDTGPVPGPSKSMPPAAPSTGKSDQLKVEADLSKLWFDLKQKEYSAADKLTMVDKIVGLVNESLGKGNIPAVVDRYPAVMSDKEQYGFLRAVFPYPNGLVRVITFIAPPIGEDNKRTSVFVSVTVDGKSHSEVFKELDVVPVTYAVSSGETSAILVSGSKLDNTMFKQGEKIAVLGFSVKTDKVSLMQLSETSESMKYAKATEDKGVYRLTGTEGSSAPYVFTEVVSEGMAPDKLFVITSNGKQKLQYAMDTNGNELAIKFVREVNN
jgi:hypothetical protein